jgi:hypothetical protein
MAFQAAFAVRQVEIGFASMLSLLVGLTVIVYGVSLLSGRTYPKWIGSIAIVGGVPTTVGGIVVAYTGFSALAQATNMTASCILLGWMITLGILMWRRSELTATESAA